MENKCPNCVTGTMEEKVYGNEKMMICKDCLYLDPDSISPANNTLDEE